MHLKAPISKHICCKYSSQAFFVTLAFSICPPPIIELVSILVSCATFTHTVLLGSFQLAYLCLSSCKAAPALSLELLLPIALLLSDFRGVLLQQLLI